MANHQIPLVEEFGVSKTLLSQIANSPYFKKLDSTVFSKILFKPGYPLQSVELIELQDILQEQIRRFGNHIFKDGSVVTSAGGLDVADCVLYELQDGADETVTIGETDLIAFVDATNSTELLKARFIDFRSARIVDGVVQPTMIGVVFNNGLTQNAITTGNTVQVYVQNAAGTNTTLIGTLNSTTTREGKFANIKNNIFYISGYFTNINEQNHIFAVDNLSTMDVEVGVELTWRIVDITDDDYKEQLFDPAQNSLNDNTPGADRLILQLELTDHTLNYTQQETDWKFIPLLKYDNGNVVFRSKYPFYSVLGDTLARRTYEINGNFVVDNFKLEVRSDLFLDGTHTLTQNEIVGTENIYTIEGSDSNYFDLVVGNYIMFGSAIDYNRLLLIKEIESATKIKVSDIHYDDYEDTGDPELLSPSKVGSTILLRDEEKLNYVLTEGKAYVKGYRFETTFTTRLKDNKARTFTTQESSVLPNQNYFEIENFVHTEDPIFFDRLEEVDLHCVENSMLYSMNLTLNGFATPLTISAGHRIQVGTNGAIFESIDGNSIYKLISYTKNNNVGLPTTAGGPYIITNLTTNTVNPNTYNLVSITALGETQYIRDQTENYSSKVLTGNQPVTASVSGPSVQFTATGGSFTANFSNGDLVIIKDETTLDEFYGYIDTINASSLATILTFPSLMNLSNDFTITKPSYQAYYNYQYNSTKIGTVRSNSVGVEFPNRFRFSHFNLINTPKQFSVANFGTNQIKAISLELSTIDDVYNGMYIEYNGSLWNISDYDGGTQTFTLDNVSLTNPFNFTVGSQLNLIYNRNNIRSLVKSTYINGKEFYADIVRNSVDEPSIKQPNQTQKKFSRLLLEGSGEVKSVNVDDYSIFYQDQWVVSGGNTSTISKNIGNTFQEDFNIDNDNVKVYAADVIYDTLGTGNILYSKGENIPISSANIVDYVLTINFNNIFVNNDAFIVHANIPVSQPIPRLKTLTTTTDTFQVAIEVANRKLVIDNNRYYGGVPPIFELKHSDIYRIRRVSVGAGKTTSLIDLTNYFDLDTGQRDTHYDYGRIVLKPYLNLPSIASLNTTNAFYYFEVEYDYFDSTTGHYFTVNSYQDIHYRKIPTYIDAIKEKFPLRNVIDFRPVRQPKGSLYDFEQETDIVSQVNYDYDYYLNEDKVISIEGNGSSDIALQYETADNYQSTDYGIKLYDLEIPAYTFSFEDVEYKMIDNRNFTMKDISKLQKRIENLEDIVQLNALELQALQTNLTDSNGDPRYTNGLLVDMFSGFAIAKVDEDGFGASIDIKNMKMFPSFDMHNIQLKPSPTAIITSSYPSVRNNIIMLPIDSHSLINDTIDTTTNTTKSTDLALHNGKLTLHPFSDTWFSESTKPDLLLNEDNQFKNWKELPVSKAFETQWNIWEQFWSGEQIDQNVPTLANATLAQKTGQMVNNKNNIEKIINDKKINTTLSLLNREIRVGFVLELLDAHTDTYEVYVNGNLTVFNQGQRLEIDVSTSTSVTTFLNKFLNFEITQNTSTSSAVGTIRNIQYVSTTGGNNKYYIYVTNVTNDLFVVGSLTNLTGTVSAVQTFNTLTLDNQNKLCGDIVLNEGDYPTDTALDIQIRKLGGSQITVASNSFYLRIASK